MKILLLGEYSNVHWTLAEGLRALGHEVTVASNGDFWKNYPRDINLERRKGRRAAARYLLDVLRALPKMRGYDVVQLINPMFLELKTRRLFRIYDYLRRRNRRVVLGAFGMDHYWAHVNTHQRPLRYSDFNIGDAPRTDPEATVYYNDWVGTGKERLNKHIARTADAIVAGLYEYYVTYTRAGYQDKTRFIAFPIKTSSSVNYKKEPSQRLRVFVGISRGRSAYKGTDIMLRAAQRVAEEYPERVELSVADGVPFAQYTEMLNSADIILDQLYAYTPAMNALEAMNRRTIVVGGGEEEQYAIINEHELRPIVNVEPTEESVYQRLKETVLHADIQKMKDDAAEYVRRHHDHIHVAKQYAELYESLLHRAGI